MIISLLKLIRNVPKNGSGKTAKRLNNFSKPPLNTPLRLSVSAL